MFCYNSVSVVGCRRLPMAVVGRPLHRPICDPGSKFRFLAVHVKITKNYSKIGTRNLKDAVGYTNKKYIFIYIFFIKESTIVVLTFLICNITYLL